MKVLLLAAILLSSACSKASAPTVDGVARGATARLPDALASSVTRITDPEFGVVCYVSDGYKSGGISCLYVGKGVLR